MLDAITPLLVAAGLAGAAPPVLKIGVEHDGVYQVSYEDLGLTGAPLDSRRLTIRNGGKRIPVLVLDGGDKRFGPGDRLRFAAEHPGGDRSWFSEHTRHNVYWLSLERDPLRFRSQRARRSGSAPAANVFRHLEQDQLRVRFRPRRDEGTPEVWYWARLTHLDRKPFVYSLELPTTRPVSLAVGLRGWSTAGPGLQRGTAQHRAELHLNGTLVGHTEWDGQEASEIRVDAVDPALLQDGQNELTITIPRRTAPGETDPIIDVALLNWIEVRHPLAPADGQQVVRVAPDAPTVVEAPPGMQLELYGPEGEYLRLGDRQSRAVLESAGQWHVVQGQSYRSPAWVTADRRDDLRDSRRQADYLMIGHASLLDAARPLAEFHRRHGLTVDVIDVEDVYDAFSHGVVTPQAIRDFVAHATAEWTAPAPRFVLLIGDASWDVHNDELNDANYADWTFRPGEKQRFRKNGSTPYATQIAQRNLVPTWSVETYEGHAASDNPFVDVDDDGKPDLAIGRLPVVTADEVSAIVDKIIAYAELSAVGPWRRNILWITNEEAWFQRVSDNLLGDLDGFAATRVYPSPEEKDNAAHQQFLRSAFDEGQLLVHFIGHGGRYIWRTGPPDLRKNHDLFTLDDVEALTPTRQLPMILSMTCYSAPFDHPTADSIGEKFLRLPDRGAIAVFAASWRNSPTERFSRELMQALTRSGVTIGEAIVQAKREEPSAVMVETYNLLGDPALELALPDGTLDLIAERNDASQVTVQGTVDVGVANGRIIVDWLDRNGEAVASAETEQRAGDFTLALTGEPAQRAVGARVYFWNADERVDAFGTVTFDPAPDETVAAAESGTTGRGEE